jgi:glycosyltransferase involved in cell wall biosynthesis
MRILLTVHQFLPEYGAGTEVLTFEAAAGLQRLGHEVCVFTAAPGREALGDDERFDSYDYKGVQVYRFHHAYVPMGGHANLSEAEYRNVFVASYLRSLLETIRPDVVHFFHLARLSGSAVEVCYELGIPMVLTPTDFWFVCPTYQLRMPDGSMCRGPKCKAANCVRHWADSHKLQDVKAQIDNLPDWLLGLKIWGFQKGIFDDWFASHVKALSARPLYLREQLNKIDRVLIPTRLMQDILISNGMLPGNIVFAPYGINPTYLRNTVRSSGNGTLRVGFIGTLSEHKGAHLLLEALRTLPPGMRLELKIWGKREDDPGYFAHLRALAGDDPRIQFCDTFPNSAIGEIFSSLDVLVVPSIWYENTPLVIYSAQAAGCPVIATDLGGMAEVIHHGKNGLLFKLRDVRELAQSLQRLCEDRALLESLAKNAITPRSIQDYVQQMEAVYEEIV